MTSCRFQICDDRKRKAAGGRGSPRGLPIPGGLADPPGLASQPNLWHLSRDCNSIFAVDEGHIKRVSPQHISRRTYRKRDMFEKESTNGLQ